MSEMLFFDTNVASKLRDAAHDEINRFWTWVHKHHRYAINPLVLAEVLKSLRQDPERHLEDVRRELSSLHGPGDVIILPLPGVFLGRTLFGIEGEHPVVTAQTMADLLDVGRRLRRVVHRSDGQVLLVPKGESGAIILNYMIDPILEGEESMFAALEATREQEAAPLEPDEWARHILAACGLPTTRETSRTIAESCTAAYALQRFLWTQAARDYNPRKHPGDWIDKQLLLYLAYPRAVFVSCEKKLPARIAGSGQEDRVRLFDNVWAEAQA